MHQKSSRVSRSSRPKFPSTIPFAATSAVSLAGISRERRTYSHHVAVIGGDEGDAEQEEGS